MSTRRAEVLKEELVDLKEIANVYSTRKVERIISHRSSVQKKLWNLFKLGEIENAINNTQKVN